MAETIKDIRIDFSSVSLIFKRSLVFLFESTKLGAAMILRMILIFLSIVFFTHGIAAEEKSTTSSLDIKVDVYPKEVFPGDIIFLKITLKNISLKNISLMKHPGNEFVISLENKKYGAFRKTKQGTYFKLDGTKFSKTFFLEPGQEFIYYEAILAPGPDILSNPSHLFWSDLESGKINFKVMIKAWGPNFAYDTPKNIAQIFIVPRTQQEMTALFTWWSSTSIDRNTGLDPFGEKRWYIYAACPELTFRFPDSTTSKSSLDSNVYFEQALTGGTLKNLLRIFHELPEVPSSLVIPRKITNDVPLTYKSPTKEFFTWFDSLHVIERSFWSTEIARTYFMCAIPGPWPTERTAWQERLDMSSTLRSYKLDQDYLDAVIADWIPRLPHPSVSSGLLIDELRAFEIGHDWPQLRQDIDFSKPLYPYREVAYGKSQKTRTIQAVKITGLKNNTVSLMLRSGEKLTIPFEQLDDMTKAYIKQMYTLP